MKALALLIIWAFIIHFFRIKRKANLEELRCKLPKIKLKFNEHLTPQDLINYAFTFEGVIEVCFYTAPSNIKCLFIKIDKQNQKNISHIESYITNYVNNNHFYDGIRIEINIFESMARRIGRMITLEEHARSLGAINK